MKNIISRLFDSKSSETKNETEVLDFVSDFLEGIVVKGGFALSFDIEQKDETTICVNFSGEDARLFTYKNAMPLNSLNSLIVSAMHRKKFEKKFRIELDVDGFRAKADEKIIEKAAEMKQEVLDKGSPVFFRPLPARERKLIHEFFSDSDELETISIGDGFLKKVKLFPKSAEAEV